MPHFVVDCSRGILGIHSEESIIARLHRVVSSTGLFDAPDIKIRIHPFTTHGVGGGQDDFIHTFDKSYATVVGERGVTLSG